MFPNHTHCNVDMGHGNDNVLIEFGLANVGFGAVKSVDLKQQK